MFPLDKQGGKYRLAWRIQPWYHHMLPPLLVWGVCAHEACVHVNAWKNSSVGLRNGKYGDRLRTETRGRLMNQLWTRAAWWKPTLREMISYLGCSGPSICSAVVRIFYGLSRKVDALVIYSCLHDDVSPLLMRNLNNGTLADDVPSSWGTATQELSETDNTAIADRPKT